MVSTKKQFECKDDQVGPLILTAQNLLLYENGSIAIRECRQTGGGGHEYKWFRQTTGYLKNQSWQRVQEYLDNGSLRQYINKAKQ